MRKLWRARAGLTLIELLIVLSILGVLAAIVLGNVTGMSSSGKESSFQEDQNSMQKASDSYYSQYKNSYPTRNLLAASATAVTSTAYIDFFRLLSQGKLLAAPQSAGPGNNVNKTVGFGDSPFSGCGATALPALTIPSGSCTAGLGSYIWWVDNAGVVHSQNTAGVTDAYNGRYP